MFERRACPNWSDRPGGGKESLANVLAIRPGGGEKVICLSNSLVGVFVHFFDGRTTPCTELPETDELPGQDCHVNHRDTSTRWQGWIGVQLSKRRELFMVALTEAAIRQAPGLLSLAGNLRGHELTLFRTGESKRSRLCVHFRDDVPQQFQNLLPEPDVRSFLFRLWGMRPAEGFSAGATRAADIISLAEIDKIVEQARPGSQRQAIAELLRDTLKGKVAP